MPVFFEDNSIVADRTIGYFDVLSDSTPARKYVWRYNTLTSDRVHRMFGSLIGSHGNQAYWHGSDTTGCGAVL